MIRWSDKQPRMTRSGGLFCFGDVVPDGYFTEAEIADLVARGKVAVELEQAEPVVEAEPAKAAPVIEAEPAKAAPVIEAEETEELDLGGEKKHSAKRWGKK